MGFSGTTGVAFGGLTLSVCFWPAIGDLSLVGFVTTPMNTKGAGVVEAASVTQCPLRPRLLDVSQADNPSEVGKSSRGQFSFCLAALDFPGVSFREFGSRLRGTGWIAVGTTSKGRNENQI